MRLHVGKSRGRSLVRAAPMRRIDRSSRRMAASHFTWMRRRSKQNLREASTRPRTAPPLVGVPRLRGLPGP